MRERTRLFRYAAIPMALIVLLGAFPTALAADGRDFSGFYELSNVTDLGETVSVRLTLEISNHREADVYDVTLTVLTSAEPDIDLGTLSLPFIGSGESVRLSGDLILPLEEYERWQRELLPMPRIEFSDAAGNREQNMVEIAPLALGEEG